MVIGTDELVTLRDVVERAHEVLRPEVRDYVEGGSGSETTLRRNRRALDQLALEQRVLVDVRDPDLSVELLGMTLPFPVIVAPVGGLFRVHEEGDLAMARGAGAMGTPMTVSTVAAWTIEQVASAATGPLLYQIYHFGDRAWMADRLARIEAAGYRAMALTVDAAVYSRRERDLRNRYSARERSGEARTFPDQTYPARLTWDDVRWLRQHVRGPLGIKGVMTAADAERCVQEGLDFIWVSNHGGRQLDDGRASVDALREIAERVDRRIPIIVDGGFQRGTDVLKGLALGATVVAMGRLPVWGLAAGGEDGVIQTLRLLQTELRVGMALAGCASLQALTPASVRWLTY